jgi:PAS domain S-box-containing protein
VNDAFISISGYSREEVIGHTSLEIGIWVDPGEREKMVSVVEKEGIMRGQEVQFRTKAGRVLTMIRSAELIDMEGDPCIISVSHDITGRKAMEEALRESEERFHEIFVQNEDALFIIEPVTCQIMDVNPSAISLYGFARQEFLEGGLSLILEPNNHESCFESICGITSSQSVRLSQIVSRKKSGDKIITSVRGKAIRLKKSDVIICSFRDITEKIRREEEARFIQAKLIQTNKMTSLGTLVSGIAHEINNPNNFIMMNSQMVSDAWNDVLSMLNEYYREHGDFSLGGIPFSEMQDIMPRLLAAISDGSERIRNIVDNLKDFSRQGRSTPDRNIDINSVVAAAVTILSSHIKKYTDTFHLSIGNDLPPVKGNLQQLEQVIINLLMNALESLPDKKKGVSISAFFDMGKDEVTVEVRDEGSGMSQEVLEHITEPFFTTRIEQGGTGLGLSISYSIIKDHQGLLTFESEPGRGTTARITLPASRVPAQRTP